MDYTDNPTINWLITEFNRIQTKNPQFSLRAFAKKLELSPGYLSQVFQGKRELSEDKISHIFEKLEFDEVRIKEINQIMEDNRRLVEHLKNMQKRLAAVRVSDHINKRSINGDQYLAISEWYHDAVFHSLDKATKTKEKLIEDLDISPEQIEKALKGLLKQKLISQTENDEYIKECDNYCFYGDARPGQLEDIRKSFSDNQRALHQRLDDHLNSEITRWAQVTTTYINIPKDEIEAAMALIEDFTKKLESMFSAEAKSEEELYCLNTQLLPMNRVKSNS